MATSFNTATTTGTELSTEAAPVKRAAHSHVNLKLNGFSTPQPLAPLRLKKKYRHVAAVHSIPRTSCLSHDSESTPSFLGFRNLMVIVLSQSQNIGMPDRADYGQSLGICG